MFYWCYYPHTTRDSVSPVCRVLKFCISPNTVNNSVTSPLTNIKGEIVLLEKRSNKEFEPDSWAMKIRRNPNSLSENVLTHSILCCAIIYWWLETFCIGHVRRWRYSSKVAVLQCLNMAGTEKTKIWQEIKESNSQVLE